MTSIATSPRTPSRAGSARPSSLTGSLPPPSRLTAAQERELEAELRRELAALDRRLASERQAESAETHVVAALESAASSRRVGDTIARRDVIADALARLAAGTYGTCAHCGEPISYGRLLVMPEATHCLRCNGRA